MKGWSKTEDEDTVVFEFFHPSYTLPKLALSVATGLNFSVAVYNWFLPDSHPIYNNHKRSLKFVINLTILLMCQTFDYCM